MWEFIIIVTLLILVILILAFVNKKVSKLIDKNRSKIEVVYIITSLLTIFSIIYGVYSFNYQQEQQKKIQDENNRIILENLRIEIHKNQELISLIENKEQYYKESNEFISIKFEYYYLEKARDIITNSSIREKISPILIHIRAANSFIDRISENFFIPSDNQAYELWRKLRKESLGTLVNENKGLRKDLQDIEEYLNSELENH